MDMDIKSVYKNISLFLQLDLRQCVTSYECVQVTGLAGLCSIVGSRSYSRASVLGLIPSPSPHTFVSPSADLRRAAVSY